MAALKKSHVRFAGRHGRNLRKMAVLEVRVPIVPPSVRRRRKVRFSMINKVTTTVATNIAISLNLELMSE
jgi:hypothetical protein